ncbi:MULTISPECIES: META domain-containing protein [unclassified Rathayibacter]|uniref:META domain-containing protein n=1 Tax=unclassified Rathayibacter TaxID=2609250 RepID=UPI00188D11AD|nr:MULTISPECIES: META domain-containing protein [unclassified Rathayibacter]MBF4462152.1 META domain-containing protein [Rathayibacter sp. VKM Ac-2879]MBF4503805.1 META domain-containing protein [Rathayibacter sp. VKM Ac-2878]
MRRRRGTVAAAVALLVVLGVSGCAESSGIDAASAPAPEELVGRWVTGLSYSSPGVPFLLLAADGTWTGSDGCSGAQGEWSIGVGGELSIESGRHTEIGCSGVDLPAFFAEAARASIDGGRLRLFDEAGATVVKLARSTSDEPPASPEAPGGDPVA